MELTITKSKQDLKQLEGVIQKNISAFYEVGRALIRIRDEGLYKFKNGGEYQTFEAYCKGVWDMGRNYANKLITSSEVIENLGTIVPIQPATESQARPLTKLEPEQQREAWKKAVETAPEGKVTAAHVSKVVKAMTAPPKSKEEPKTHRMVSEAMGIAEFVICHLERIRQEDPDRNKAFQKVSKWCEDMMIGGGK